MSRILIKQYRKLLSDGGGLPDTDLKLIDLLYLMDKRLTLLEEQRTHVELLESKDFDHNKLEPKEWFCEEYSIGPLDERLEVIEHKGNDVIRFIELYMKYLKSE